MTTQFQSEDFDRNPALSQTAWALQELQLYGTRAFQDEVDLRPMPEPERPKRQKRKRGPSGD